MGVIFIGRVGLIVVWQSNFKNKLSFLLLTVLKCKFVDFKSCSLILISQHWWKVLNLNIIRVNKKNFYINQGLALWLGLRFSNYIYYKIGLRKRKWYIFYNQRYQFAELSWKRYKSCSKLLLRRLVASWLLWV